MKEEQFETKKELLVMSIDRLFVLQKMLLKDIRFWLEGNDLYDKNDIYQILIEIDTINLVITNKIQKDKKKYV